MDKKPLLLCLSKNPELLDLRRRVLDTRYNVTAISTLEQMKALPSGNAFDLLVLCHTLSANECSQAVELARWRWPEIKLLAITAEMTERGAFEADLAVGALQGPKAMFEQISILLQQPISGYRGSGPTWQ